MTENQTPQRKYSRRASTQTLEQGLIAPADLVIMSRAQYEQRLQQNWQEATDLCEAINRLDRARYVLALAIEKAAYFSEDTHGLPPEWAAARLRGRLNAIYETHQIHPGTALLDAADNMAIAIKRYAPLIEAYEPDSIRHDVINQAIGLALTLDRALKEALPTDNSDGDGGDTLRQVIGQYADQHVQSYQVIVKALTDATPNMGPPVQQHTSLLRTARDKYKAQGLKGKLLVTKVRADLDSLDTEEAGMALNALNNASQKDGEWRYLKGL